MPNFGGFKDLFIDVDFNFLKNYSYHFTFKSQVEKCVDQYHNQYNTLTNIMTKSGTAGSEVICKIKLLE